MRFKVHQVGPVSIETCLIAVQAGNSLSHMAREALHQGLQKSILKTEGQLDREDLSIDRHRTLTHYPYVLVSLSHTKDYACAAFALEGAATSIGVDIEQSERTINPRLKKYFVHSWDSESLVSLPSSAQAGQLLKLWCLKEACFKALSPYYQQNEGKALVLKHIWVQGHSFGLNQSTKQLGECQVFTIKAGEQKKGQDLYLALAYLSSDRSLS